MRAPVECIIFFALQYVFMEDCVNRLKEENPDSTIPSAEEL